MSGRARGGGAEQAARFKQYDYKAVRGPLMGAPGRGGAGMTSARLHDPALAAAGP